MKIAVVGKYFTSGDFVLSDVYISVLEAIKYSTYKLGLKPIIEYRSSLDFEDGKRLLELKKYDGVIVPGGFGKTGIEGKLKVIGKLKIEIKGIKFFFEHFKLINWKIYISITQLFFYYSNS